MLVPTMNSAVMQSNAGDRQGFTFDRNKDLKRLNHQQQRVYDAMCDGQWRTLAQIHDLTGDPEASISARLRDFRKVQMGGHRVDHERVAKGLWRYRLIISASQQSLF
jgi:hypothetical protein